MSSSSPERAHPGVLFRALWALVLGGGLAAMPGAVTAGPAARPALYSAAQAETGQTVYGGECAVCHGATLEGRVGPALKGEKFASAASDFAVSDVFLVIAEQMPAGKPGTLSHDEYAAIMAYLLKENGYPAGATALSFEAASTSMVPLVYSGR